MRIAANLDTYSAAQLALTHNDAVEMLGTGTLVKKFATKSAAVERIEKLCKANGLTPIVGGAGFPLLVKATAVADPENFEASADELAAQAGRPSNEPVVDETTATDAPALAAVAGEGDSATTPTDAEVVQPVAADKPKRTRKPRDPNAPKAVKAPAGPRAPRAPKVSRDPSAKIVPCREGTNQALLVDMLFAGTTIGAATAHINAVQGKTLSEQVIYSTMLYDVCTMKGYGVESSLNADGVPFFKLRLPVGMTAPLPHTERKAAAAKPAK